MEPDNLPNCSICRENLSIDQILFTCGHIFCFNCFPYILYNLISNTGIKQGFFIESEKEYQCMLCENGKTLINFQKISTYYSKLVKKVEIPGKCEFCEKESPKIYCIECDQNFCEKCFGFYHIANKKFVSHRILNMDEKKQSKVVLLRCNCPAKKIMELFCLKCKTSICKYCSKADHDDHQKMPLIDIFSKENEKKFHETKDYMMKFLEDFSLFHKNSLKNIEETIEKEKKEFDKLIEEIISLLYRLKEKNLENSINERRTLKNQLSLIQTTIGFLKEEIESISTLHPNKIFQISQLSKNDSFSLNDFQIKKDYNKEINEFKETLSLLHQQPDWMFLKLFEDIDLVSMIKLNSQMNEKTIIDTFISNPVQLLDKEPIILENETFDFFYNKSNNSCSFILNDESFLVWINLDSLNIYNLSQRKKETILKASNSKITNVSVYQIDSDNGSKKWLYYGDRDGILRVYNVYNIKNDKNLEKIYEINVKIKTEILSAVIFEDKFNEISPNDQIYAVISFGERDLPLRIYQLKNEDKESELVREIKNPENQFCFTINFYSDEIIRKNCFFFGFAFSFVKMYDLKSNVWIKQFETKTAVNSINFVFKQEKDKINHFLVYSQDNNLIKIANVDNEVILRQVELPKVEFIYDVCVWDRLENNLIIAAHGQNCLKVISFENLEVLKSVETKDSYVVNLIKVLRKDKESKVFKEILVALTKSFKKCSVALTKSFKKNVENNIFIYE